jgi:hypothetical protein
MMSSYFDNSMAPQVASHNPMNVDVGLEMNRQAQYID